MTNYHVIADADSASVTIPETGNTYEVLGVYDYSIENDWAVLNVDGSGFEYLNIGDSTTVLGGATVYE